MKAQNNQAKLQQQAQLQLMEALLIGHYQDTNQAKQEQRIQAVINRINKPQRLRLLYRFKPLAMAASLGAVVFMLSLLLLPHKSAMAEINHLIAQLQHIGDRVYGFSVTPLSTAENSNRIVSNNQQGYKKSAAKWLNGAQLYLRNQSDYLLMYQTQHGTKIKANTVNGSWKLNEKQQYQPYPNNKTIKLPLSGQAAEMAMMDFPVLLTSLKNSYQLTYQEQVKLNNQFLSLLTATPQKPGKGVKQIQIYYQPDNYLIQKMVFTKVHLQGQPASYRIELILQAQQALDPAFFTPDYHRQTR